MIKLFIENNADISAVNPTDGTTPLHIIGGVPKATEIIPFFLENAGEAILIEDVNGDTPYEYAIKKANEARYLGHEKFAEAVERNAELLRPIGG